MALDISLSNKDGVGAFEARESSAKKNGSELGLSKMIEVNEP
jgi:hypothetical protein